MFVHDTVATATLPKPQLSFIFCVQIELIDGEETDGGTTSGAFSFLTILSSQLLPAISPAILF
jgi:hypothetical protein